MDGLDELFGAMPPEIVERMGRMSGLAYRAVLAYCDGEADTVAAVVDRVGTWDDDPGRADFPLGRYDYAVKETLRLLDTALEEIQQTYRVTVPNEEIAEGAVGLIEQHGPAAHREAAVEVLRGMPAGTASLDIATEGTAGPVQLCVAAAAAAAMYSHPRYVSAPQAARLMLLRQLREAEGLAIGAPARERITEVSDAAALDFLAELYDDSYARLIPRSPSQRGPWEIDMLAVLKAHLLETPASATTPEQEEQLKARLLGILRAAAATPLKPSGPPPRGPKKGQRAQPSRKKPKKKR